MNTHNFCFYGELRKYEYFSVEKLVLSGAMFTVLQV